MIRKFAIFLATAVLVQTALAGENKQCTSSPDHCATQIRQMLANSRYLGIKMRESRWGIEIYEVTPQSPAALAGLQKNDRIIGINGRDVTKLSPKQFKQMLGTAKNSGKVTFAVVRLGSVRWAHARLPLITKDQLDKIVAAHVKEAHASDRGN